MLSKPRFWCEQLGMQPWWHPQLFHIQKLTESWCDWSMRKHEEIEGVGCNWIDLLLADKYVVAKHTCFVGELKFADL
jgi:hypothetical protein